MCVICHLRDKPTWRFRSAGWTWRNLFYRGRRGEGNPAPWIMLRTRRFGLEIEFDRRLWTWLKFRRIKNSCPDPIYKPEGGLQIGNIILGWRIE